METAEAALTPGYVVMGDTGVPCDARPMRLSEIERRRCDVADTGYGVLNVLLAADARRAEGLCIECGVLKSAPRSLVCIACCVYLDGLRVVCPHDTHGAALKHWSECGQCVIDQEG